MDDPVPPIPQTGGTPSSNRNVMILLSYLWLLALVPLVVEKDDAEVQWHAKHGLVLMVAELICWFALNVIFMALGSVIGCLFFAFMPLVAIGFLIVHILCIVKGINGGRFTINGLSQYADRF